MFGLWCPVAGCQVLRWSGDIVAIAHPERGAVDVLIRCHCGQMALLRTGRAREGAEEAVHGVDPDMLARQPAWHVGVGA